MIVIHEGEKEIAIYADVVSDGKTFFRIKDLDNLYQRFGIEIPPEEKHAILKAFDENKGKDDVHQDIFDLIKTGETRTFVPNFQLDENNLLIQQIKEGRALIYAVALATQNTDLLSKMVEHFDVDVWRIILKRKDLSCEFVNQLAKHSLSLVRQYVATYAKNKLDDESIKLLRNDSSEAVRRELDNTAFRF